ncbi:MAG TPA: carboxypeptidase regulatory-like domain-containing protein, partial [Bryobacteraceae bacterium]|nr:carboxypeptidase regulatory-like domain-containing protein [Bryobacteraceae bacterium]
MLTLVLAQAAPPTISITGVVLDPSEARIVGASVFLVSGNKETMQSHTDGLGEFRFDVVPGSYQLRVEHEGFETQHKRVNAQTRAPAPLSIAMTIAEVKETLTIGDENHEVSIESDENLNTIRLGPEQLADLPLINGDIIAALQGLAGLSPFGSGGTSVIVDGVPTSEHRIPLSEILEVSINKNPYSAEFARPGKARIEIITKSGSSKYHGAVSLTLRDYHLDARNAFAEVRQPQERRQLDANFSGPVHGNKRETFSLVFARIGDDLEPSVYAIGVTGPIIENASRSQRSTYVSGQYVRRRGESALSLRYSHFDWSDKGEGTGGFVLPGAGAASTSRYDQFFSSFRGAITPKLVNELAVRLRTEDSASISLVTGVPKIVVLDAFTGGSAQVNTTGTDNRIELTDTATWSWGRHLLKTGINVPSLSRAGSDDQSNSNGTFYFSSLRDYASGRPFSFVGQAGNGHLIFWEKQVGAFVQDDVKLRRNLMVSIGMRYDWQNYGPNNHPPAL